MYSTTREYEACVLVNSKPVTEVSHNGQTYIEGRSGTTYELKFHNKTNQRVKIIPSVDGLNVLDGKLCGIESPGYVVEANSTVRIPGWKVDGSTAAKFQFNSQGKGKTYAEAQGTSTENQGTIGFMVFPEKKKTIWDDPYDWSKIPVEKGKTWPGVKSVTPMWGPSGSYPMRATASMGGPLFGSGSDSTEWLATASASNVVAGGCLQNNNSDGGLFDFTEQVVESDPALGTGWGKATTFKTTKVDFECADPKNPAVIFVFHYDTLKNLKNRGVPVEQFKKHYSDSRVGPNPFPASPEVMGSGCTPPPGWKK